MQVTDIGSGVDTNPVQIYSEYAHDISADLGRVVFSDDDENNDEQIFLWQSSSLQQITPFPAGTEMECEYPTIGGNHIVYWKDINALDGPDPKFLVAHNLTTNEEDAITFDAPEEPWRIDGNILVFETRTTPNNIKYTYLRNGQRPVSLITEPVEELMVNNSTTQVSFSGTASDSDGTVATVEVNINNSGWVEATGTTIWQYNVDTLAVGNNILSVRSWDDESNCSDIVNRHVFRNVIPTLVIESPSSNTTVPGTVQVAEVSGTASDNDGRIATVEVQVDDGDWYDASGTDNWYFLLEALPVGTTTVNVRAVDDMGDTSNTETRTITRAAPDLGNLTVTIEPPEVATAGAQWRINEGVWMNSGATLNGLLCQDHLLSFTPIDGWIAPAEVSVTVNLNQTTYHTGTYVEEVIPEGEGEPVEGEGEPDEGEPTEGEIEGEPVEGEPIEGESLEGEFEGEPIEGELVEGEPVEGETFEGEPVEGEAEDEPETPVEIAEDLLDQFDQTDTNGDGALSFVEASRIIPSLTPQQFIELDKDGDGSLSQEELLAVIAGEECTGCRACMGCCKTDDRTLQQYLGDWLLVGLSLLVMMAFVNSRK